MKKALFFSLTICLVCASVNAQQYYQDVNNPDKLSHSYGVESSRKDIVLPAVVDGFNVYTADLHTHSIYSDASVLPEFRVREAWMDGLDIMAITEHI